MNERTKEHERDEEAITLSGEPKSRGIWGDYGNKRVTTKKSKEKQQDDGKLRAL